MAKSTNPGENLPQYIERMATPPSTSTTTTTSGSATVSGRVAITNFPASQHVIVDSLPSTSSTGGLTDAELRAADVKVTLDGEIPHVIVDSIPAGSSGLTDTELRASAVPVSLASVPSHAVTNAGTFAVQVTSAPTTAVTGPLTDAQLRATAVPVSTDVPALGLALNSAQTDGTQKTKITDGAADVEINSGVNKALCVNLNSVTSSGFALDTNSGTKGDGTLRVILPTDQTDVPVTGPLTDTQLRATPVPVSGTVTATTGGLTDTQLRATAVPISVATIPSHAVTNAGTFAVQVSSAPSTAVTNTGTFAVQVTSAPTTAVTQSGTWDEVGINDSGNSITVDGPVTDAELRASSVPIVHQKLATSTYCPTAFKNLGANATLNVKASAGNVFSLSCYNANAATRYIQLHNTATVPSASDVPIFSFFVPTGSQIIIGTDFFTNEGVNFSTGIAFAFSTARDIYTAGSAGDQSTWVQFK